MENKLNEIAIVGLGLMGGSLAQILKIKKPDIVITGIDYHETLQEAEKTGIIDKAYSPESLKEAVRTADIIFLCTPISEIIKLIPVIARHAKPGALITDMGSTKVKIMEHAEKHMPAHLYFLGGHPMAGSEGRSLSSSDPLLYENAVYVLTPSQNMPPELIRNFGNLLEALGAGVLFLSPALHDKIAAAVSHLPQLLAVALINMTANFQNESSHYLKLAAGGFRDMTRIASSPWETWKDILDTNQEAVKEIIDIYIGQLTQVKDRIAKDALKQDFQKAAQNRLSIPRDSRGFLRPYFDIRVWVEDKPGVIARIAACLGDAEINIKDIEVLKVREGDAGTFRLSFETESCRQKSIGLLTKEGYTVKPFN